MDILNQVIRCDPVDITRPLLIVERGELGLEVVHHVSLPNHPLPLETAIRMLHSPHLFDLKSITSARQIARA